MTPEVIVYKRDDHHEYQPMIFKWCLIGPDNLSGRWRIDQDGNIEVEVRFKEVEVKRHWFIKNKLIEYWEYSYIPEDDIKIRYYYGEEK